MNSTSRYKKILKQAKKTYPDIQWIVMIPGPDLEDFGDGFIIEGNKKGHQATYFVLWEDPRKDMWIMMIASQLEEKIYGPKPE